MPLAQVLSLQIVEYRNSAANGWKFPLLSECREAWEKRYGPTKWDTDISDWGDEEEEQPMAKPKPKPEPANVNVAPAPRAYRRY